MKIKNLYTILIALFIFTSCDSNSAKYDKMPKELGEISKKIDKNPEDAQGYFERAQYYYERGFMDKGFEDIAKAVKIDDKNSEYLILLSDYYFADRETDLVEETLQKAIANDNSNEAHLKLAELYYHLVMIDECNETLDAALHAQAHNPRAHLIRAFCLKEKGDTTEMVRMLQLCIDQDPTERKAFLELGYYYQNQKNPLAIQYYQNALALDPNDKEINYNLAKLYQDLEMIDLAKTQYQQLLQIHPENYGALNGLGYIALVYDDEYETAINYFTQAIEIDSLFPMAVCNRANTFEQMGKIEEARQDYNYCRQIAPNYQPAIDGLNRID